MNDEVETDQRHLVIFQVVDGQARGQLAGFDHGRFQVAQRGVFEFLFGPARGGRDQDEQQERQAGGLESDVFHVGSPFLPVHFAAAGSAWTIIPTVRLPGWKHSRATRWMSSLVTFWILSTCWNRFFQLPVTTW